MTDTPERIALRWQPGAAVTSGPLFDHPDYTRFVREDVAAAMVAAEREALPDALLLLDKLCFALERRGTAQDGNWGWPRFEDELTEIRTAIRKRGQP